MKEFDDYFKPRRIWLPSKIATQIDEYVNEMLRISVQFCQEVEQGGSSKGWIEAIKAIIGKAQPLRASLESEFRRILRGSEVT